MPKRMALQDTDDRSRYLIGIDLGTTNSAMSFVDTEEKQWIVRDFAIPQLVGAGQVEARDVLPSFHYEAADNEFAAGTLRLPWDMDQDARSFVGIFARDHGAEVPGRLISSAKSWLSHSGVDRTAGLLPWHGAADVQKLSPVEASSRYLAHLRAAWDAAHPEHPLSQQDVVLAVPASFDEVARELTIQAAQRAGLARVFLVEEPQAAFYAWIDAQGSAWDRQVQAGQTILVCDVGGGTSDFTLIRVRSAANQSVLFQRVAVGEHLILGGDNLDLALAHHVEQRLGGGKLRPPQWAMLIRVCRQVKETFLGNEPPERMTISVAAPGSRLIGGALQVELTRKEAEALLLDGFLPMVELTAKPAARRSGFQEFGLPYAADAAITRYLAAFLRAHVGTSIPLVHSPFPSPGTPGEGQGGGGISHSHEEQPPPQPSPGVPGEGEKGETQPKALPESSRTAHRERTPVASRPDLVLFNGGLFESPMLRKRLVDVLRSWFGDVDPNWTPKILQNERMDLAVARGAAYYAMVRRGRGQRISGGLAHSYYLGVETQTAPMAVCLLPAGVEQGETVDLGDRRFALRVREPAEFPLYFSSTRTTDRAGELVAIDREQLSALPPIRTVLQSSQGTKADSVSVQLHARLTEVGTLDIWCGEIEGERRWKLQFDVRSATQSDAAKHGGGGESLGVVDEQVLCACREIIRSAFTGDGPDTPAGVVKKLESVTAMSRHDWPPTLLRSLWEVVLELEDARRRSVEHEARWLSLLGFSLRPGYGLAVDDWRVSKTWKLYQGGTTQFKNELCRAEWWILWRRIAGGLVGAQQSLIGEPLVADWRTYFRKGGVGVRGRSSQFQFGPHESAEVWRLLGSLELLRPTVKSELGEMILGRLGKEKSSALRDAMLFAIGRIGARQPVYGPLNTLISADEAGEWLRRLTELNLNDERALFAAVQLARRTDDRNRDLPEKMRLNVIAWLKEHKAADHLVELVSVGGSLGEGEQKSVFGETLPRGLRIE